MIKLYIEKGKFDDYVKVGDDDIIEVYIDGKKCDLADNKVYDAVLKSFDSISDELYDTYNEMCDLVGINLPDVLPILGTKYIEEAKNLVTKYRNSLPVAPTRPTDALSEKEKDNIGGIVDDYVWNVILKNSAVDIYDKIPAVRDGLMQFAAWLLKK